MAYIRIKYRQGRAYRYWQRSYREGGKVKTETRYLGPVDGGSAAPSALKKRGRIAAFLHANLTRPAITLADEEKFLAEHNAKLAVERAALAAAVETLHAKYGLTLGPSTPVPVEAPQAPAEAPAEADKSEGPAGETGPEG